MPETAKKCKECGLEPAPDIPQDENWVCPKGHVNTKEFEVDPSDETEEFEETKQAVFEMCGDEKSQFYRFGVVMMASIWVGSNDSRKIQKLTGWDWNTCNEPIMRMHETGMWERNKFHGSVELFDPELSTVAFCLEVMNLTGEVVRVQDKS